MNDVIWKSRKELADQMLSDHSDKVPVILAPFSSSSNIFKLTQSKFLVPRQFTFHDFIFVIRKKLRLSPKESLFIMVNSSIFPNMSRSMHSIYNENKSKDKFLYIFFSSEPVWG